MLYEQIKKVIKYPKLMLWAFVVEGIETSRMMSTFLKEGQGILLTKDISERPSEEEMEAAIKQLKDIPKMLPFFVFVIVPMPGATQGYVLLAITLEKFLGEKFSLLPKRLKNVFLKIKKEQEEIKAKKLEEKDNPESEVQDLQP